MAYLVTLETMAEQPVAAARQRTTFKMISRQIGEMLSRPWTFLRERIGLRTDGNNVAIYWEETGEGSIEKIKTIKVQKLTKRDVMINFPREVNVCSD